MKNNSKRNAFFAAGFIVLGLAGWGANQILKESSKQAQFGPQRDGSFIVSTEQRLEPGAIAFDGRPIDIALHPSGKFFAVLNQTNVLLGDKSGVFKDSISPLPDGAGFRGAVWTPDGKRLFVSISNGNVQEYLLNGHQLEVGHSLMVRANGEANNPRPGGMCITKDGKTLFVALADKNAVAEMDIESDSWKGEIPVQNIPFEVRLSEDERTLIVSNWAGRIPTSEDDEAASGGAMVVVDPRGVPSSGTVTLIDRSNRHEKSIPVGLHPTALLVQGGNAYVANAGGDSISVIDLRSARVKKTIPIKWGRQNTFGSMPDALAMIGNKLYVCDGGDNAVAEVNVATNKVMGFRPAGYYPTGIVVTADGSTAYVVNTKGNGSVRRSSKGIIGNVHDFQGTVSVLDLNADLTAATQKVVDNNHWTKDDAGLNPELAVYHGAIKHVIYIIKENRTYDEVFGDLGIGNGDPKLCDLGIKITPNAHALAKQFALFDNAYVSGTNSADGHTWSTQALCNDYLEHFYAGYRTYPDDGVCAMTRSTAGNLWDAAKASNVSFRNYGEYCDQDQATFTPKVHSWMEVWNDRLSGSPKIKVHVQTVVPGLKPYTHPSYVYWPLLQSDQQRADLFIDEYSKFSHEDKVPSLMTLALPCDHTEGLNPDYPKPQSMVADNDLALGRIVESVSHSPQWKDTCIFVIEDDAQSGPDHVDGHRTVFMAYSPYIKRGFIDHSMYNTVSMIRSIELMLKIPAMNRFDSLTPPMAACFNDLPDLTPYSVVPNEIPLDEMNAAPAHQGLQEREWTEKSMALDWSGPDRADPAKLNKILWHALHHDGSPYPFEDED